MGTLPATVHAIRCDSTHMIDITRESTVSFAAAPAIIPGRPHISQVYRWASRGLRGIRLEWVQVGGQRYTSREAIQRFISRLTAAAGGEAAPTPPPARRQAEVSRAESELVAAGYEVGGAA